MPLNNPFRKVDADKLYAQLGRLIESTPNLTVRLAGTSTGFAPLTAEQMLWLGRAEALVNEALGEQHRICCHPLGSGTLPRAYGERDQQDPVSITGLGRA